MSAATDVVEYGPAARVLGDRYKATCAEQSFAVRCSACPGWESTWLLTLDYAKAEAEDHARKHSAIEVKEI